MQRITTILYVAMECTAVSNYASTEYSFGVCSL